MDTHCNSHKLLKRAGIDLTAHRETILDAFLFAQKALTPQDILKKIRKLKSIDKVTLYRILDLFVNKRVLRKISAFNGPMRYEIICQEHHPIHPHFICRDCGHMECLNDMDISRIKNSIRHKRNFREEDIDLKLEGLCKECEDTPGVRFYA